jgi:hypothetical protein
LINIWMDEVDNYLPAVAYNNQQNEYMVVWYNARGATRDVYARRISADGTLLSQFTVADNANFWIDDPDIAYSPVHNEYLIAYRYETVSNGDDIRARRVNWDGSLIGSEILIGRPDKTGDQANPAVAYNDQADEYIVVYENRWGDTRDIDAQRVRASDGGLLSWRNIATGAGELRHHPDVAYSPGNDYYLITYWFQLSSSVNPGDVLGKVTSSNMSYLSGEIDICVDSNDQRYPAVVGTEDEFLVVWEDSSSHTTADIYARRIASDGIPLGPPGGFWITGSPGISNGSPHAAAGSVSGYLITWYRYISGTNWDVFARFVMPGDDIGNSSEFVIDDNPNTQWDPASACSSAGDCLVVEQDNYVSAGGDFEIRGRMLIFDKLFLPVSSNNY